MRVKYYMMGVTIVVLSVANGHAATTPAQKCQAAKNQAVAKYDACRLKAEAKLVVKGDMTAYGNALIKCTDKHISKWGSLEQKAANEGDPCPSTLDQASILSFTNACSDAIATALGGSNVFAAANLAAGNIKSGQTIFGVAGTLTVPKSGQTTAYGAGSDGDVEAGSGLSYTDNGDGTITDNVTGLMWEKKDDSGGIHDKDNGYSWSGPSYGTTNDMDGTISTVFLATLNAGAGFAGHTDWRIPNYKELVSILNLEIPAPGPTVDAAFHKPGTCTGCMDVTAATCSCMGGSAYWSSTTYQSYSLLAWLVLFDNGFVDAYSKSNGYRVRAVRGGL